MILATSADLVEIFSSVQGEGPSVGASTLFVRFGGCDLRCRWCDSPHTWKPSAECRFETSRGSGRFRVVRNPVPVDEIIAAADDLDVGAHRMVSLTGGEPLLQPEAVRAVADRLRGRGPRIHLETHGAAPEALEAVVGAVDVVSMDWKLVSDVRRASDPKRGEVAAFHDVHERFLRIAVGAPEVVVKVVVTLGSRDDEIDELAQRVARTAPDAVLVLQPVTPFAGVRESPGAERLLQLVADLSRIVSDVRLIPQTHRVYGAL